MNLKEFWAKSNPFQSIVTHGIVSGYVCISLMSRFLSCGALNLLEKSMYIDRETVFKFVPYLVSLHDIGKLEADFQCKLPEMKERLYREGICTGLAGMSSVRHEQTGQTAVKRIWDKMGIDEDAVEVFSAIISAHHQKNSGIGKGTRNKQMEAYQAEYEKLMRREFFREDAFVIPDLPKKDEGAMEAELLGLMILSDWIASSVAFSDAESWICNKDYQKQIENKTKQFLHHSGLEPIFAKWPERITDLWTWMTEESLRPLQSSIEALVTRCPEAGLILIEAPMGEGKTEAGVYAALQMAKASGKDGFYISLPTAATSNQMVSRVRSLFDDLQVMKDVRLLHSMAWLTDHKDISGFQTEDRDAVSNWLAPTRRALLGQYAVGTIDQALLSVSKTRFGVLRLLGLNNKVLIFDEIHSYDVYMGCFIQLLLKWARAMKIPVVMLSATIPPELKSKLLSPYTKQAVSNSYPLVTAVGRDGTILEEITFPASRHSVVSVQLLEVLGNPKRIAQQAEELVRDGGCICVLMNTVTQAQQVYSELEKIADCELLLFHAQFPVKRRDEIEKTCLLKFGKDKSHRPARSILVATQVVEQSLDVDFDAMITSVAPIDLLIQRMGRIFRHDNTIRPKHFSEPKQIVLVPEGDSFGADSFVYPEVLLRQTIHILKDREQIRIPEDIAHLVAEGYDSTKAPASEAEKWLEKHIDDTIKSGQSQKYLINPPEKEFSAICKEILLEEGESNYLSVQTRLGEPSVRIALLEKPLYTELSATVIVRDGIKYAPVSNRELARKVIEQSVSVRKRRLSFLESNLSYTIGDKLISGVWIVPSEDGAYLSPEGSICYDNQLGVIIKEGKK